MTSPSLLVVAGETSGDAMAAGVLAHLRAAAFGMGGERLAAAGAELCAHSSALAGMGVPAPQRALRVLAAGRALLEGARRHPPRAALLVGFSELNARLAPKLQRLGARVCWLAPPQIWAWRRRRAPGIAQSTDALALTLPFELEPWRRAGARALYVGHPALERAAPQARAAGANRCLALLPGSRPEELERHLPLLLEAASDSRLVAHFERARLVLAPGLARTEVTRRLDRHRVGRTGLGIEVSDAPIDQALLACNVALAASGTVTMDCVAARTAPVIFYRTGPLTFALARRLVRLDHVGLPNLILGRRAFPELLQDEASPAALATAALDLAQTRRPALRACDETIEALRAPLDGSTSTPSERVARVLDGWL